MAASQTIRTLKLSLLADTSGFNKNLQKGQSEFQKFASGIESASRFAVGALGAIGAVAFDSVQLASDLAETSSKVEQIFGLDGRRQLERFAETANESLGQTRRQALDAAATFGIFGQAAGLSGSDLVDFSTDLTGLASDLASFNNTDVDQAIVAIGAALRGESEPIRNFGVLLNEQTLRSRALALGLVEDTDTQLTQQQKVLAAQAEILAQTTTQQGDFERTADGLANKQRILTSRFEDFRTELGEQLLPVAEELLPRIEGFLGFLEETDPETIIAVGKAIGIVAGGIVALNTALRVFSTLKATAAFLFGSVAAAAGGLAALGLIAVNTPAVQREATGRQRTLGSTRDIAAEFGATDPLGIRGRLATGAPASRTAPNIVNVTGFVGSEVELGRAVNRALEEARRNGSLAQTGSFR
jgi:hypothetical protein